MASVKRLPVRLMFLAALLFALAAGWAAHATTAPDATGTPPAATPLQLSLAADRIDAWPALRVLPDPGGELDRAQALARLPEFAPPTVPKASFGQYRGAMWSSIG